jgi:VanZ family protein
LSVWRSRFVYWWPAILVAILISTFSTHYFSDRQTARVIIPILRWLFPSASGHALRLLHIAIRKLAHVTEFAFFSITVFRGIRAERQGWRSTWALTTLVIAVTYAGLDEWHQSFVPLRHASARDVAIDAFGALLAQGLVWVFAMWKSNSLDNTGSSGARAAG